MQRQSLLGKEEPIDALCHHFNVARINNVPPTLAETFEMPVIRDAHMPTHVLAAFQTNASPNASPLMLPIDANLFAEGFNIDLPIAPAPPGTTAPIPYALPNSQSLAVKLPVVKITVPHSASLPLLLLFGMGLERHRNDLAWRLLPTQVVAEFPNASAMAEIFSRYPDQYFEDYFRFCQGMWKNVLALALKNNVLVELVQIAWNVTNEARRIRHWTQRR